MVAIVIPGSPLPVLATSQSRDYGITKLVKILLFRVLNERNKTFRRLVNKNIICALESHSLLCTVIRILTVIITPCSSDMPIPSVCTCTGVAEQALTIAGRARKLVRKKLAFKGFLLNLKTLKSNFKVFSRP